MQLTLSNLSLEDFIVYFLRLVSSLKIPSKRLAPIQLKVLQTTLLLPDKYRYRLFTYATKKYVASLLLMSVSNLNNRIYELIDKGYLIRDTDKVIYVSPSILKAVDHFKKHSNLTLSFEFKGSTNSPSSGENITSSPQHSSRDSSRGDFTPVFSD